MIRFYAFLSQLTELRLNYAPKTVYLTLVFDLDLASRDQQNDRVDGKEQ